jgi:hypothetical protein
MVYNQKTTGHNNLKKEAAYSSETVIHNKTSTWRKNLKMEAACSYETMVYK